jgi:hypothetical protein
MSDQSSPAVHLARGLLAALHPAHALELVGYVLDGIRSWKGVDGAKLEPESERLRRIAAVGYRALREAAEPGKARPDIAAIVRTEHGTLEQIATAAGEAVGHLDAACAGLEGAEAAMDRMHDVQPVDVDPVSR